MKKFTPSSALKVNHNSNQYRSIQRRCWCLLDPNCYRTCQTNDLTSDHEHLNRFYNVNHPPLKMSFHLRYSNCITVKAQWTSSPWPVIDNLFTLQYPRKDCPIRYNRERRLMATTQKSATTGCISFQKFISGREREREGETFKSFFYCKTIIKCVCEKKKSTVHVNNGKANLTFHAVFSITGWLQQMV